MNSNFTLLDAYLSGDAAIPALDVTGTVTTGGVVSGFVNTGSLLATGNVSAATGTFSGIVLVSGSMTIGSISGHVNQTATGEFAGSCNMVSSSSCNVSLISAFTSQPICIATEQSAATPIAGGCEVSGTTVTIGAASANSGTWAVLVIGNPN